MLVEAVDNETNLGAESFTGDDDDGGSTGHVKQKKNFTPSSPAYAAICLQITISAKKQANNNDNGKTTATAAAAALLVEESDNLINAVALVTCRIISMRQKTRFWIHFYFASRRGKKWLHKDKIITVIIIFEFSFKKVFLNKNLLSSSPSFLLIPSQQPGYDICPISFYVLPFEHNEIAYKS